MPKINWQREEPGWYTSEAGGICRETSGWYFHPRKSGCHGPYKTLAIAVREADKILGGLDDED